MKERRKPSRLRTRPAQGSESVVKGLGHGRLRFGQKFKGNRLALEHHRSKGNSRPKAAAWRRISEVVIDQLFPPTCVACDQPTETPVGLCAACWRDTFFLSGHLCDRCGAPLQQIDEPGSQAICDQCLHHPPAWDQGRCVSAYEGAGRRAVLALKHADRTDLAPALAQWLSGAAAPILRGDEVVVPVPLHRARFLRRRYNQAAELGRALSRRIDLDYLPDALVRQTHTPPQKGKRAARVTAMQGAFCLNPRRAGALKGRRVLLLDDVITTGATLSACAETLRAADPEAVNVLALARVLRDA